MHNILTTVENLKPGDNLDLQDNHYVIYDVRPSSEKYYTDIYVIGVMKDGTVEAKVWKQPSTTRFVTDRPA